ncbi:exported hypothetical protein [Candidatus Xenohaliotis californiensis]|uniref:Uncharacterized protein n=1 Tax=Candidatus Xenohaliotis californiensis TaxID=84677 RepID=A0ABM9N748_9RICK|nr:exported hypothetical protein [Candidatus Xenohaliotis californiensis]
MKNNTTILAFVCLILLPCITWSSCFNTNGHDENVNVNDDFCNAYGYVIGYEKTPEMSATNPNAAFDPIIKAKHCTCFFGEWVGKVVTLREGECSGLFTYVVYADKEQIGVNNDGHICHPGINNQDPSKCQTQTTAICLKTSTAANCHNTLNITEHILKCLPIPITPGPPAACKQMITKTYPKIIPVSLTKGNSYFQPKIKLMLGENYKTCNNGVYGVYRQPISDAEHSSGQYRCPAGDSFVQAFLPEAEVLYDIDPFNETNDTFTHNAKVMQIKFKPSFDKICIEIDGLSIDCIPRNPPKVSSVSYNSSKTEMYYTLTDENNIQKNGTVEVVNDTDVKQQKMKTTPMLNKNLGINLYATRVSGGTNKSYLDYYINCPNGDLVDAEQIGGKTCTDIVVDAYTCNGNDVVNSASECSAGANPQKTKAKKCVNNIIPNTPDVQCPTTLQPNYTANGNKLCIFGYNDNNVLVFDSSNNKFTPSYKTPELLFPRNASSGTGIGLASLDQSELNTYSGTINQGTIVRNNSKSPPAGTKYELKHREMESGANSTIIFDNKTHSAVYLTTTKAVVSDPLLSNMCTAIKNN